MSMIKPSLLTALLLVFALSAVPCAGRALSQRDGGTAFAQAQLDSAQPASSEKDLPADAAVVLYRVMGTVLVVWIGLAVFLFRVDRKLSRLEKEVWGRK